MFELFTNEALLVIMRAQDEACRLRHNYVGTEQLLLGLFLKPAVKTGRVLTKYGVTYEVVSCETEKIIGQGKGYTAVEIPFTKRAKVTLNLARDVAEQHRHSYIAPEHLLMGVMKEGQGIASRVLNLLGVNLSGLESALENEFDPPSDNFEAVFYPAKKAEKEQLRVKIDEVRSRFEQATADGQTVIAKKALERLKSLERLLSFDSSSLGASFMKKSKSGPPLLSFCHTASYLHSYSTEVSRALSCDDERLPVVPHAMLIRLLTVMSTLLLMVHSRSVQASGIRPDDGGYYIATYQHSLESDIEILWKVASRKHPGATSKNEITLLYTRFDKALQSAADELDTGDMERAGWANDLITSYTRSDRKFPPVSESLEKVLIARSTLIQLTDRETVLHMQGQLKRYAKPKPRCSVGDFQLPPKSRSIAE